MNSKQIEIRTKLAQQIIRIKCDIETCVKELKLHQVYNRHAVGGNYDIINTEHSDNYCYNWEHSNEILAEYNETIEEYIIKGQYYPATEFVKLEFKQFYEMIKEYSPNFQSREPYFTNIINGIMRMDNLLTKYIKSTTPAKER